MAKEKITDVIFDLALPLAKDKGLDIYDVEFKKEGSDQVLRVILDTPADAGDDVFVSINDCEDVSRRLSNILDEKDPVKEAYILEVTSPGLDRPLKKEEDFKRFNGRSIDVGLYKAKNGSKVITGLLKSYENGNVTIELEDKSLAEIEKSEISSVKLTVIF